MSFQIGDFVTWRGPRPNTIGLSGCKIVELGRAEDGTPAAMIDIGRFAQDGQPIGVRIKDLKKEKAAS